MQCCCMYCFQHFVAESVFAVCHFLRTVCGLVNITSAACYTHTLIHNNTTNLQAFQLIVLARYLLGVPNPSPVSQHALT